MSEDKLKIIELKLAELETQKQRLINEKEKLENGLDASRTIDRHLTSNQKIELFMSLFRGRTDIYARHWKNAKGRSGYSIACYNEWAPNLCHKPKVKCGECFNQSFKPLSKRAIYEHLSGKAVIGLYPLFEDDTTYLLAIDFDKSDWKESVRSAAQACVGREIPHAIETSRSGEGAHLWVFFSERVPASDARKLGFCILDIAMESYPSLSFDSYDRLFPSQDTLPEGGFGNLIALPLQLHARNTRKTEFVDEWLMPYENQWQYLSQLSTVSPNKLHKVLAFFGERNDSKILEQESGLYPWEQGAKVITSKIQGLPATIKITLANHIYLPIDGLPSRFVARLRRMASFSNPVFFKTQAMRFSTHGIPRYISCARIEVGPRQRKWLSLPRGCLDDVHALLDEQGVSVEIDDQRNTGARLKSIKFLGKLRKNQVRAINVIVKHDTGVLHAPTAFGKTVTAIGVIKKRKTNTLILTHNKQLLEQWRERLNVFCEGVEIGVFYGGKKKSIGQIDIATYQSLIDRRDNSVNVLVQTYGHVIVDECHHLSAPSFEMVMNEVRAKFVLGLTATPHRQDGHQKIIFMLAGPVRHYVKPTHSDKFEQNVVVKQLNYQCPSSFVEQGSRPKISDIYRWIVENEERTNQIVEDVNYQILNGRYALVLTERRQHAEELYARLETKGVDTVILRGAMGAKDRKLANERLPDTQVVVATGRYVGEGFDLPKLDTLFLAMPIAWKGRLAQYAGRIHRESEGKDKVIIIDYVDTSIPMLERMFRKREKGYKLMGYKVEKITTENREL